MKTLQTLIFLLAISLLISCGKKEGSDSKEISEEQNDEKFDSTKIEDDTEFAVEAADGGLLEVKLGELAQSKGSSAEVKQFAAQMVTDHTQAGSELKALAQQKNISIPVELSEKNQKEYDELSKKTGVEFDRDYTDFMVKDHKEDIDSFQEEADKGRDSELKSWAAAKLPTLKHHLTMAEQAQTAVRK